MGFEENRFVDISDDFKCSICLDVFENPIMSPKCEHLLISKLVKTGKECINRWIGQHISCPIDGNNLFGAQMCPLFRFFTNAYERLRLKCEFVSNGCQIVLNLTSKLINRSVN
jgi:hypothetical protein